jgi:hypothetical protein
MWKQRKMREYRMRQTDTERKYLVRRKHVAPLINKTKISDQIVSCSCRVLSCRIMSQGKQGKNKHQNLDIADVTENGGEKAKKHGHVHRSRTEQVTVVFVLCLADGSIAEKRGRIAVLRSPHSP